jgi:hypothetical protein
MTVNEALQMIQGVGTVAEAGGKLKLAYPERMRSDLQPAIEILKADKQAALAQVAQLRSEELTRAGTVLKNAGVRIMALDNGTTIGVWADLDGPEVQRALRIFGSDGLPILYLDGAGIPSRYKERRVEGEPVPLAVLEEMERHLEEPWTIRDRLLTGMGWCPKGVPWAEWKAASLNRLLCQQGVTGEPGRITAKTVRHGESAERREKS